jgi:hypothetical protein
VTEERTFVENWWQRKFSMANLPTRDDVIMFAHALELLKAFRGAGDARWMTGPTEKNWLEAWWLRKFPANPPKWGSVLNLADAEELLVEVRKGTEARWAEEQRRTKIMTADEKSGSAAAEARKRKAKERKARNG